MKFTIAFLGGLMLSSGLAIAQDCNVGGPYSVDGNTLMLLHLDEDYVDVVDGELPTNPYGTFTTGRHGQGILGERYPEQFVDFLIYDATGNITAESGTLELWLNPNWSGLDAKDHQFFWADGGVGSITFKIDAAGTLRFDYWHPDYPSGIGIGWRAWSWLPGEWHHLGVTWDFIGATGQTEIAIFVDAQEVNRKLFPVFPLTFSSISVTGIPGTPTEWGWGPDAVIDEVRISDIARCFGQIAPSIPQVSCAGFEPPLADYPVTVKKNRALPLKAQVFDVGGYALTGDDLLAPPVLQVLYDSGVGGETTDVTEDALSAGQGTEGNQFVFTDEGYWQFNLKTKDYTAPGTYIVTMESGEDSEYVFGTNCMTEFAIQ